jgi:hypothetical protein
MVTRFGGMATSPCVVGKTNFGGSYINGISNILIMVDVDQHSSPFSLLQWAYDLASQPKDFIVNAILDS